MATAWCSGRAMKRALLALVVGSAAVWFGAARMEAQAPEACALQSDLADTRVVKITAVAAGDALPGSSAARARRAFCRVEGVIEKEIGFELWLPLKSDWNGKMLGAGVGGQAGSFALGELARGVGRGYASASTDTGHKASDRHWLLGDPMRAVNYAERANHLLALRAKALVAAYYGKPASRSVFIGCSGGGRQAMTQMQRFPDDYDAIIAGAPGVNSPEMSARRMWEMVQHSRFGPLMKEADWKLVVSAAIDRCDADDGVTDRVIGDPRACRFDIGALACAKRKPGEACLSEAQVSYARLIYSPLHDENGKRIDTGLLPGTPVSPVPAPEPFTPGPPYLAVALFGDGVHRDPDWNAKSFRIADDLPAIDKVMNLHADNPNVDAFVARGGKLIIYHGLADPLVSPTPTIDYVQALEQRYGRARTAEFARLFLAPGMDHCRGGGVPDQFGGVGGDAPLVDPTHDLLSAIESWSDGEAAPADIVASKVEAGKIVQTRRLCAFPAQAQFRGGDSNDAANFACVESPGRRR